MTEAPAIPPDHPPNALPAGTRLGEFELRRVIGVGGFGIVYLALDHALQREVAVKEYMPAALAGRTETLHVSLRSQSDAETFALGLKSFVNEARLLARFELPSLVRVFRFWEANGTAYMAMPVVRGQTLKALRSASREAPDEDMLRTLLAPLLDTLEALHAEGVYHRDIAPDNIVIEAGGRPVLLDLGAARRVIGDKTQTLTAILKPAYAPIEQYAEAGSLKQGPWTDLYALGATLHYLMLGKPPAPATTRTIQDEQAPLAGMALPGISPGFAQIVDWMLAPRPADRPQNAAMLRDALAGRIAPVQRTAQLAAPPAAWERTQIMPGATGTGGNGWGQSTGGAAAGVAGVARAAVTQPLPRAGAGAAPVPAPAAAAPGAVAHTPAPTAAAGAGRGGRRAVVPALMAVALAAVAGGGWWWSQQGGASASASAITIPAVTTPGVAMGSLPAARDDDVPPAPTSAGAVVGDGFARPPGASTGGLASETPASPPGSTPDGSRVNERVSERETARDLPRETARQPSSPPAAAQGAARPAAVQAPAAGLARGAAAVAGPVAQPAGAAGAGAPSSAPVLAPPDSAGPSIAAPTGAAPRPAAVAQPATGPAPAAIPSPSESCGRRYLIALNRCMERECARPELRQHPQCLAWRDEHDRRTNIKN
jgi:hypothetical protein